MKKILLACIVVISGCATLPTISSVSEIAGSNSEYSYYNSESKILYKVTNNEHNLHIILNTTEQASIMKILKTGLTIYFDTSGKKKKDVFIHYPFNLKDSGESFDYTKNSDENQQYKKDLNFWVSRIPKILIFSSYNKIEKINLKNDSEIIDSISVLRNNEIVYELIIPFSRISKSGINLSKLSIGIVSGKFDMEGGNGGGGRSGGDGMMTGGGMGAASGGMNGTMGGGSGRPRGGAPGGVGSSPGNETPENVLASGMDIMALGVPIDFWFKVNLYK